MSSYAHHGDLDFNEYRDRISQPAIAAASQTAIDFYSLEQIERLALAAP